MGSDQSGFCMGESPRRTSESSEGTPGGNGRSLWPRRFSKLLGACSSGSSGVCALLKSATV